MRTTAETEEASHAESFTVFLPQNSTDILEEASGDSFLLVFCVEFVPFTLILMRNTWVSGKSRLKTIAVDRRRRKRETRNGNIGKSQIAKLRDGAWISRDRPAEIKSSEVYGSHKSKS